MQHRRNTVSTTYHTQAAQREGCHIYARSAKSHRRYNFQHVTESRVSSHLVSDACGNDAAGCHSSGSPGAFLVAPCARVSPPAPLPSRRGKVSLAPGFCPLSLTGLNSHSNCPSPFIATVARRQRSSICLTPALRQLTTHQVSQIVATQSLTSTLRASTEAELSSIVPMPCYRSGAPHHTCKAQSAKRSCR